MGTFQNMLNNLMLVEQQGFDPVNDSYSARIGKITTNTNNQPVDNGKTEPTPYTREEIVKTLTDKGYEDLAGKIPPNGKIDESTISTVYSTLKDNPDIGLDQDRWVETTNEGLEPYEQRIINPDTGSFMFKRKEPKPANYKFEISPRSKYQGGDVYLRYDVDTGETFSYDTKEAYQEALDEYKKVTGIETTDTKTVKYK